jgi:5'(3')-deoxyribonucleotidase
MCRGDFQPKLSAGLVHAMMCCDCGAKSHFVFTAYSATVTAPWHNPTAWGDKLLWVQRYLNDHAYKRLILSHHKHLNRGHYLVDDRPNNGATHFLGMWLQFGSEQLPDWEAVKEWLMARR